MSLRLWLPLRGDTTNNGLDQNIEIEAYKVTADADGKIGSCYLFNGSDSSIKITDPNFPTILNGDFSICMWIYNTDSDRAILFGNYENSSTFAFSLEKYAEHGIRFYWNGNPEFSFAPALLTLNTWVHIAITKKGNTVKGYMNGVLQKTSTATLNGTVANTSTVFRLGRDSRTGTTAFNGKMNDFRLYDHELSAKEVKEISQALIQHFPLNDFVGNENLLLDTMSDFSQTHDTYEIVRYNFSKALVEGNTYTITCKVNMSEEKKYFAVYHSGASYKCGDWQQRINSSDIYSWTFTATAWMASQTSGNGYGYVIVYVSNNVGAQGSTTVTGTANVDWIKIEEGSVATPYIPNKADSAYSGLGFDSNTVYDVSGYCNNGTFSTNKPTLALGSPRYSSCMSFNGSNNFIACGRGAMVKDEITVNAWAYMDNWGPIVDAKGNITSCTEGGGWNFEVGNGNTLQFPVGTGTSSNTYKVAAMTNAPSTLSGWVMFTGVYDGLNVKLYINGSLVTNTVAYSTKTPMYYNANNCVFIGAEAGGNANTPAGLYFNGKISDFRVYATALSDADILELYNSPISIDNTGKVHALEFREV